MESRLQIREFLIRIRLHGDCYYSPLILHYDRSTNDLQPWLWCVSTVMFAPVFMHTNVNIGLLINTGDASFRLTLLATA
jgi:hypothetical protein